MWDESKLRITITEEDQGWTVVIFDPQSRKTWTKVAISISGVLNILAEHGIRSEYEV